MQQVYQFFRLIRFTNIVVMVLTMCFFYGLLSNYHFTRQYILMRENGAVILDHTPDFLNHIGFADPYFLLLMLSVVLIGASGNIINDYFDLKADRVNKPGRLIIDKYIKRRWAIILNWSFNGIGFLIALYLSYRLNNWWIASISFLSINLLYFYSAVYKRKLITGNIIVAFLTALVPLYVFVYGAFSSFNGNGPFGNNDQIFVADNILAIVVYCGFAFLLNLIREIIKDMADVKGDLLLQSQTLPIRFGFKKTKLILIGLYALGLSPLLYFLISADANSWHPNATAALPVFIGLLTGVVLSIVASTLILYSKNQRKFYLMASNFLKLAMLFGVISALFYY